LFLKYEKENLSQEELNDLKRRLHNVKGHSKFLNINIASETAHIIENIIEDIINSTYKKEEIIDLLIEANSTLLEFYNSFNIINDSIVTSNDSIEILFQKLSLFKKDNTNKKPPENEINNISSAKKEVPKSIMETTSQIPEIIINKDYPEYDYKTVDEEILNDFLNEANEMISTISLDVLALEKNKDIDLLNKIFRVLHTLKGSSGMIKMLSINYLAHSLEEILDMIRKNELVITSDIIDILLEGTEKIQNIISKIEKREEPNENVDGILTKIARIKNKQPIGKIPTSEPIKKEEKKEEKTEIKKEETKQVIEPKKEEAKKEEKKETAPPQKVHPTQQSIRIDTANLETVMNQMGELIIEKIKLHSYVKEFLNYEMNLYKIKELIMDGQQNISDLTNKIMEIIDHTTNHKEKLLVISEGFERLSNNLQNSILKMRLVAIS